MKTTKQINEQITTNQQEQSAIAYALYLVKGKRESALSMLKDCPQNIYIEEWKREEQSQAQRVKILEGLSDKLAKESDKLFDELRDLEKNPNKAKYYDTFYGHKVSDYGLEHGRLDYATMSKCFDAVLCNNIVEIDPYIFDNVESGDPYDYFDENWEEITREEYDELNEQGKETHEQMRDIFQWYIVSDIHLLQEAGELVLYSEALDCYIWGVDHWGTSWDYVLTNIKLEEREGE